MNEPEDTRERETEHARWVELAEGGGVLLLQPETAPAPVRESPRAEHRRLMQRE